MQLLKASPILYMDILLAFRNYELFNYIIESIWLLGY